MHRMPAADAEVIVVGGAVAGGALANALGSRGIRTLLIEKVSESVRSTRGDLLHPPTLAILERLGVLAALHADGALPISELAVSHARRGRVAHWTVPAAGDGPAGRTIAVPHDRIEAVLYACALRWPSVRAERGRVIGLERDEDDRAAGVRLRLPGASAHAVRRARVVVGCDGAQSLVRRELGIGIDHHAYNHEELIIGGEGSPELPAALHWYVDQAGGVGVVARPRGGVRVILVLHEGERGDLLQRPDPALRDYVVDRFPALAPLRFGKADGHVYRLGRHLADRFWAPGAALVGDAAHATHPAGATGMSLAITAAERLAKELGPALRGGTGAAEIDAALAAYDADRRPAAAAAVRQNHAQAERLWEGALFRDPEAFARAVDPRASWGVAGAGWGQNPAALAAGQSLTP